MPLDSAVCSNVTKMIVFGQQIDTNGPQYKSGLHYHLGLKKHMHGKKNKIKTRCFLGVGGFDRGQDPNWLVWMLYLCMGVVCISSPLCLGRGGSNVAPHQTQGTATGRTVCPPPKSMSGRTFNSVPSSAVVSDTLF